MISVEIAYQIFGSTSDIKYIIKIDDGNNVEYLNGVERMITGAELEYKLIEDLLPRFNKGDSIEIYCKSFASLAKGRMYKGRHTRVVHSLMDKIDNKGISILFKHTEFTANSDIVKILYNIGKELRDLDEVFRNKYKDVSARLAIMQKANNSGKL